LETDEGKFKLDSEFSQTFELPSSSIDYTTFAPKNKALIIALEPRMLTDLYSFAISVDYQWDLLT
jgi:hypothetical protein